MAIVTQQRGPFNPGKAIKLAKLHDELVAASIPVSDISYANAAALTIYYTDLATSQQMNADTDTVITDHSAATTIQTYALAFLANKKAIANIGMTFSERFRTSSGSVGDFRLVISDTLPLINALPAAFVTEFQNERTGYYSTRFGTPPADNMAGTTLAQCQTYYDFLAPWIARLMGMLACALAGDLD